MNENEQTDFLLKIPKKLHKKLKLVSVHKDILMRDIIIEGLELRLMDYDDYIKKLMELESNYNDKYSINKLPEDKRTGIDNTTDEQ